MKFWIIATASCRVIRSRPARGAWVEMLLQTSLRVRIALVAPRKGRVG